jgi:uncharacterized membrane protein YhiD involved in acid resistance
MITDILGQAMAMGGRLVLAALLTVIISYRRNMDRLRRNILEAHAFLGVAGALFIMIIGDQIERAVGLIGVATVIRYRYAIRDPKDAGTLLIALGLGMGCGAGLYGMAIAGAAFVLVISFLLDLFPQAMPSSLLRPQRETFFRIVTTNPDVTLGRLESILESAHLQYTLSLLEKKVREVGPPQTAIEGTLRFNGDLDVADLTSDLADESVVQIQWRELDPTRETR